MTPIIRGTDISSRMQNRLPFSRPGNFYPGIRYLAFRFSKSALCRKSYKVMMFIIESGCERQLALKKANYEKDSCCYRFL